MRPKVTYYKINEARPKLSKLVNRLKDSGEAYVIGNHNTPKAMLIDIETANKYLPDDYRYVAEDISDGERFYKIATKLMEKRRKAKKVILKLADVDKIVYGI